MRRERTDSERLSDDAVLLALWSMAQQRGGNEAVGDRLKMMKLAFLTAYSLYWDRVKALNLRFYRYTRGPFSQQVSSSWDDLCRRQLLAEDELFSVTEEGQRLADGFTREVLGLEENKHIRYKIESVAEEYGAMETQPLLDRVYAMQCYTVGSPGKRHLVKAVAQYQEFTDILEPGEEQDALVVPPGWQITLELAFDPDALRNLQRGIDDATSGRLYGWDALGTHV
jgi:hypothetical protein